MNKLQKIIILSMFGLILGGFAVPLFAPNHTLAVEAQIEDDEGSGNSSDNPDEETKPSTSILPSDWKIENLLNVVLVILTTGISIAASIAFVVAGVLYSTAGGNSQQVQKAKTMILNTIIGLISYSLLWAFAQWLIPGGVF